MDEFNKTAQQIFDHWAQDHHADGMEHSHWESVKQAFQHIPTSEGNYLEIGCGNGYGIEHMTAHQYRQGHCFGLDISEAMIKRSRSRLGHLENISLESGDFLTWFPLPSIQFSCIFSMEVFYYFENIQSGIDKAASLLGPDGMLMVCVNYYQENESSHAWPKDLDVPMVLWSTQQYREGFQKAGLKHVKQHPYNTPREVMPTLCTVGWR